MSRRKNELSLGEAIEAWLQETGMKEKVQVQKIKNGWPRIMGEAIARNTERIWFNEGVLHIRLSHPMWRNELQLAKTKIKEMANREIQSNLVQEVKIH